MNVGLLRSINYLGLETSAYSCARLNAVCRLEEWSHRAAESFGAPKNLYERKLQPHSTSTKKTRTLQSARPQPSNLLEAVPMSPQHLGLTRFP